MRNPTFVIISSYQGVPAIDVQLVASCLAQQAPELRLIFTRLVQVARVWQLLIAAA